MSNKPIHTGPAIHCLYDKLVKVADLKIHPENANKHSKEQIERLAKIINYQGWRYPIKVSNQSGFITSGHGRLAAAIFLKLKEVPVNFQDYENQEQEFADVQSDNAIASWAELDLSFINSKLENLGPDFDIDLLGIKGFEIEVADKIPQCDEDSVPEHVEPKARLGDIYQLGEHRLMCGDSTSIDAFEKLMDGQKADMVFTDPPYGMNLDTSYQDSYQDSYQAHKVQAFSDRKQKNYKQVKGDDAPFKFLDSYALVENVPEHFWWGADYYCQNLPRDGSWFVWNKRTTEGLERMYGNHFELCWSKIKHKREIASITWSGMLGHNRIDDGPSKTHPTMKAIKLIEWFFERFEGEKVIDLFGGSGSTLIACEKTNRKCFMMEIDPHYVDVIVARWEKYTGKKAQLLNNTDVISEQTVREAVSQNETKTTKNIKARNSKRGQAPKGY